MKNENDFKLYRKTKETSISIYLDLKTPGQIDIITGIGFFDHMLTTLAFHSGWSMTLKAEGDLHTGDHHTVEDCAIIIGQAIEQQLYDRSGITRFGYAYAPLDDSLSRAVIDLASRPNSCVNLSLAREKVGELSCENVTHFFQTLTTYARFTLHLDTIRSINDHHAIESAFKAFALAFKSAIQPAGNDKPLSTKGVL